MVTRDLYSNLGVEVAIESETLSADKNGETIDTQDYSSLMFAVNVGESGDTLSSSVHIQLEVEESDDDSTWTDVDDDDLTNVVDGTNDGTFAKIVLNGDQDVYLVGYKGSKRYVRIVANLTGSHTNGTPIGAVALLGHAHLLPVN